MPQRACVTCGTPYTPRHARHRWCDTCEPRGNAHRSPTTRARDDGTGDYQRNRAVVLAGHPTCAYCDQAATTVDHIVPVVHGGGHDLANLAPACAHCNYSRGGKLAHPTASAGVPAPRPAPRPVRPAGPTRLV